MKKSILSLILAVVFAFGATEGMVSAFASVEADRDTPVAQITNDDGIYYDYSRKPLSAKEEKEVAGNISNEVESIGGYVETYSSREEYEATKEAESLNTVNNFEEQKNESVQQVIKVMTTATGSVANNNYVASEPVANAIVRINGVPRFTDRNGEIKVSLYIKDYVELFVEKEGYNPYVEIMEVTGEEKVVHIKQPSNDIDIYAVMLNYDGDSVNLLNQSYGIDLFSQDDSTKAEISICANIILDNVILLKNGKEILSTNNQKFVDLNLCQFAVGDKLSIVGVVSNIRSKELTLQIEFFDCSDVDLAAMLGIEEDKDINIDDSKSRDGGSLLDATMGGAINFGINALIRKGLEKIGSVAGKRQKEKFVTFVFDNKHKVLKVILGVDLYRSKQNGTIPGENALMSRNNALESYESFQRSYRSTISSHSNKIPGIKHIKGLWNGFKLLATPGNFKPEKTKGVEFDLTLFGFIEIDYSDKHDPRITDIGATLDIDFAATIAGTFMVWVIPCYWYITFGMDFNVGFNVRNIDEIWKLFINIDPTFFVRGGLGVGINGLASVGGALQVELDMNNQFNTDFSECDINSSGYVNLRSWLELHLLFYTGHFFEKEWVHAELWDTWKDKGIEREGQQLTEGVMSLSSLRRSLNSSISNQYYEFAESRPQIVSINDSKKLIVWVGDNVLRSENNFTQLYYAVIENGEIGEPKVVYDDGTADFIPTLINKDGEIYLAWQNCNKVFNDDATILDVSSSLEIAIAKYDAESNQFCNITNKTNNNQLDAVPKFSKANGKLVLCWQANSESNLLFNTGVNYIYQSIFDGNNWSEPQMIMSTDSVIVDFDISNVDGESMLLYTLDMDEDLTTMDDRQVFIKSNTEKAIVEGVNLPKFENIDNKLGLYYLKDGKLYYISNINSSNLDSEQITGNDEYVTEYKIINNKTILYSTSQDELRLSLNSGNKWSWGAKVHSFASGQLNYYEATSKEGRVSVIYLGNENSIFNLDYIDYEICYDLEIQDIMIPYAFNLEKPNELTVFIRNNGAFPIYNFEIMVDGVSDKIINLDTPIMPSEIYAYEYELKIDEYKQILLEIVLLDSTDVNQINNCFEIETKVGELALTSVENRNNVMYYTLKNYSDFDINLELTVELTNYANCKKTIFIRKGEQITVEINLEDLITNVFGENDVCVQLDLSADVELLYPVSSSYVTKINIKKPDVINHYSYPLEISKSLL